MTTPCESFRRGNACLAEGDFATARLYYKAASEIKSARWNQALLDLLEGYYDRWPDADLIPSGAGFAGAWQEPTPLPTPRWDGRPVGTITVVADQGSGDLVIFARYLPQVKQRCQIVKIVCHRSMATFVQHLPGVDVVEEEISGGSDAYATFMELPPLLSRPVTVPELTVAVPRSESLAAMVQSFGPGPRVGVCWSGNPQHPGNAQRSVPKDGFYGLPVKPFNLQYGEYDRAFYSINAVFSDFLSTAQVIQEMDLVITCSTSISVMAPTLGVPTWVLLDTVPYWVWGLGESTPWYPRVRLFRQPRAGQWGPVLEEVRACLARWTAGAPGACESR